MLLGWDFLNCPALAKEARTEATFKVHVTVGATPTLLRHAGLRLFQPKAVVPFVTLDPHFSIG